MVTFFSILTGCCSLASVRNRDLAMTWPLQTHPKLLLNLSKDKPRLLRQLCPSLGGTCPLTLDAGAPRLC